MNTIYFRGSYTFSDPLVVRSASMSQFFCDIQQLSISYSCSGLTTVSAVSRTFAEIVSTCLLLMSPPWRRGQAWRTAAEVGEGVGRPTGQAVLKGVLKLLQRQRPSGASGTAVSLNSFLCVQRASHCGPISSISVAL